METIEMTVFSWSKNGKYLCPKCSKLLEYPDYECNNCLIKLKIKVKL
jgi:DNA-directed RNA polymerase subunit RPC12/RpoP